MGFQVGHKKVAGSGMKRGQRTRRSLDTAEAFNRVVETYGDPLEALAALAFNPATEPAIKMAGLKELCQYGYAKRKTVDIVAEVKEDSSDFDLMSILDDLERKLQQRSA